MRNFPKIKPRREQLLLAISNEDRVLLEAIAVNLGFVYGSKPNISAMLRAIARGNLKIVLEISGSVYTDRVE